ncbi:hypothetical protein [Pseudomonas sp. ANT_J28]|uniref:hypothetical protein n=1 Tax=Pseudomonas sp. ANT_J28 TaxID=2597352 RepID=UPI0011F2E3B0|nr:hypothetical protein [Pseudomonas sp. ANT_J28]KAA0980905.1 hypothetical protein FQ187_22160 [Pseudomonas sp. ANT_J28]
MPERIYFYCDESGAKGYADQQEKYPGEVGVFAGLLVPEQQHAELSIKLNVIAKRFTPEQGKLHIADLPEEQKGALRQALFDEIRAAHIPCFWYAIHVAGFNDYHIQQAELLRDHRAQVEAQRNSPARVKMGSVREELPSLHVKLFGGLHAHVVAFLLERNMSDVDLLIRTDHVDEPLAKEFEKEALSLLDNKSEVIKATGFDTVDKRVVNGQLTLSVHYPADMHIPAVISNMSLTAIGETDGLILAADVLANSLNYHFKSRTEGELYAPLNDPEAVANHPLYEHLDAFYGWSSDLVGDGLFAHPKASH